MIQVNILATTNEGQLSQKQARYSVTSCNNQVVSIPVPSVKWCLFHLQKKQCHSTPIRTYRDYRHFTSSTPGFSRDVDLQLLDLVKVQEPADLANYVSVIIDEMYIKEGLVFDKHTGSFTGFTNLGDVCNLLAEYEQQQNGGGSTTFRRPAAKCMVVFMVWGLIPFHQYQRMRFIYSALEGN